MRISDWSSDVCSSDLLAFAGFAVHYFLPQRFRLPFFAGLSVVAVLFVFGLADGAWLLGFGLLLLGICHLPFSLWLRIGLLVGAGLFAAAARIRSEEHTSELQSLMRISYAVFCLKKKKTRNKIHNT